MWVTIREQDVLGLLLQGCTNKEIARQLSISDYTVRDHVSSLLRKNQVKTRAELMARCVSLLLPEKILDPLHLSDCVAGQRIHNVSCHNT